jgi:branched-subunit amino acid ABC-type transport system permease component
MHLFVGLVIDTILIGSLYGLFSLGLTLVFGVLDIANFAFAATSMAGGYTTWDLMEKYQYNVAPALLLSGVAGAVVGVVTYFVAIYPIFRRRDTHFFAPLLTTLAVNVILVDLITVWFGPSVQIFITKLPTAGFYFEGQFIGVIPLVSILVGILLAMGLWFLTKRSRFGLAARAVQSNRRMAELIGIHVPRTMLWTLVISSVAAAFAGSLIAVSYDSISPESGTTLLFLAFAIVILGGLGSIVGAVVVAYVLAAVDVTAITLLPGAYQNVILYGIVLVVIVAQSMGLFGKSKTIERV